MTEPSTPITINVWIQSTLKPGEWVMEGSCASPNVTVNGNGTQYTINSSAGLVSLSISAFQDLTQYQDYETSITGCAIRAAASSSALSEVSASIYSTQFDGSSIEINGWKGVCYSWGNGSGSTVTSSSTQISIQQTTAATPYLGINFTTNPVGSSNDIPSSGGDWSQDPQIIICKVG